MKPITLLLSFLLFMPLAARAGSVPTTLAGIQLGADIATIHHCCQLQSDIPLAEERHLNEIDLKPQFVPGIRSGSVAYATCSQKGKIVRIKLKFDDSSMEFYEDLLKRYEKTFGKPGEWRGTPMKTIISWKWSFTNPAGEKVGLELTHSDDDDYKLGNFVKLSFRSLWEEEAACLNRQRDTSGQGRGDSATPKDQLDYSQIIPK